MVTLRPVWLGVARAWARLTQTQLAERVGCSQARISKVESGIEAADPPLVERLCDALGVPRELLCASEPVFPQTFMFHRRKHASKRDLEHLWATLNILRVAIGRVLTQVELAPTHEIRRFDPEQLGGASAVAASVRAGWMIEPGPIPDLVDVVENAGIIVVGVDFGIDAFDGVSHGAGGTLPPIIFVNSRAPGCRLRHTIAHELGHIMMHELPTPTMEDEADEFAAEFLMPANEIRHLLRAPLSIEKLAMLKPVWGTSMASLLYRARRLGTVTEDQYRRTIIKMAPYRRVEPIQVPVERPTILRDVVQFHLTDLGYSHDELRSATLLPADAVLEAALLLPSPTGMRHPRLTLVPGRG